MLLSNVNVVVVVVVVVKRYPQRANVIVATYHGSSSLSFFLAAADAALMSREASLSLTEETIDSTKLRPIDGVLKESMNEDPRSPIVISFKNGLTRKMIRNVLKDKRR